MKKDFYHAIQIDAQSWRIEEQAVRFYLFTGRGSALLVDTGFGSGDARAFVKELTDLPLMLVHTHGDHDHTGGNTGFETCRLHPSEFAYYTARATGDTGILPIWEGDIIDLGGRTFEIILIPGHTPGSIALLDRENRILVAGDTISKAPVYIFGENRSIPGIIASLKKLEDMSECYDTVYPSHGSFPLGKEAVSAQRTAAEQLLAGKLKPRKPPVDVPAKWYVHEAASFFL